MWIFYYLSQRLVSALKARACFAEFSESRMLRQRRPGGRSGGRTRRRDRVRVAEVPPDALAAADILEYAEPGPRLAPDYLIYEVAHAGESPEIASLRAG